MHIQLQLCVTFSDTALEHALLHTFWSAQYAQRGLVATHVAQVISATALQQLASAKAKQMPVASTLTCGCECETETIHA